MDLGRRELAGQHQILEMNKNYFIVTTNGHTASKWLSRTLASIEGVACSHGAAHPRVGTLHHREYTNEEKILQMSGEIRKELPISKILNELTEMYPEKQLLGNVHMYNLRQLQENKISFVSELEFEVVDIVRHPVSFIQSGYFNMISQCEFNPARFEYLVGVKKRNIHKYEEYAQKFALDLNNVEILSFMANVMTLKSFEINFNLENFSHRFTMEELTSSVDSFLRFFRIISKGEINTSRKEIQLLLEQNKTNSHNTVKKHTENKDVYLNWKIWQQELFKDVLLETKTREHFEKLGYDFSFI